MDLCANTYGGASGVFCLLGVNTKLQIQLAVGSERSYTNSDVMARIMPKSCEHLQSLVQYVCMMVETFSLSRA